MKKLFGALFCISVYLILVATMKAHALDRRASDINPIGKTFGACSASQSGLPLCKGMGLIMSASEIVAMLGLQATNYTKNASSLLENNWGMAGTSAGAAGLGALALWGASAGSEATTLASQVAIAEKNQFDTDLAQTDDMGDIDTSNLDNEFGLDQTSEATGTTNAQQTQNAQDSRAQIQDLKNQKAQKDRDEKNAACFSAIVSAAMAGVKWYDYTAIQASSNENVKKLHKFVAQDRDREDRSSPSSPQSPTTSPDDASSSNASLDQPELSRGIRNVSSLHKSTSFAEEVNHLPSSAVTAALRNAEPFNRVGTASAAEMARAFDEFRNLTGIQPGTLAQDAQQNGIGKTMQKLLSQFPQVNPKLLAALGSFDSKLNQYLSKQNSTFAFEDTKSILRSQKNDHSVLNSSCIESKHNDACKINNSNEQNLSRTPASAIIPKSLSDHQLDDLILHKSSSRTIFEIVSDRTQSTYSGVKP